MPVLRTSQDVVARTAVVDLPEYTDLILITDAPGFAVRRQYPAGSELRQIVNHAGEELVRCLIQLVVDLPRHQAALAP